MEEASDAKPPVASSQLNAAAQATAKHTEEANDAKPPVAPSQLKATHATA